MATGSDIRIAPWMQDTLRQGFELLAAGRFDQASACCRRLLGAKPDLIEGHFLVGLIAMELKQTWTAASAFGSVTKLQPNHAAAWAQLARLFVSAGQPKRGDAALARAVEHNDGNPVVLDLIGTTHGLLGDQEQASVWITKAVKKEPDAVPFLVNLANNHMFLGKLEAAERDLHKVLKLQPGNPNAHWILSNVRKARDEKHIQALEELLAREQRNPQALAFLYYGLGKELEDLQQWDRAYAAFERGASHRRLIIDYDEQAEVEMFDAFSATFTADWLQQNHVGCEDPSPIFIVGQPRTGTTLVERIVTSHSSVHSAGELRQFGTCLRRLSNYREPKRNSARLAELAAGIDAKELGNAYLATTKMMRGSKPRFVDKLPPNYLNIPLILKALPNAKIIHLNRDPMDACFSSYKQLFADAYPHSYDQAEMARHHARYFHIMSLWRERFPGRFFDIAYEDIARDLEPNARALIDYLQLPWEDACLNFHQQTAAVTTASAVQVRQPVHTGSIGRWRRYKQSLDVMQRTLTELGVPMAAA